MPQRNWKDLAELIGIAAIVASLIFVGMQMRQTHEIALATLYQMRSDATRELRTASLDPSRMHELLLYRSADAELSEGDLRSYGLWLGTLLSHFENSHYLFSLGFLPAEHWEGNKRQIVAFLEEPRASSWWNENKEIFRASFVAEVEMLRSE
jgi:hypothetical protein